jgi:hypothetical protein
LNKIIAKGFVTLLHEPNKSTGTKETVKHDKWGLGQLNNIIPSILIIQIQDYTSY